jgi:hypothetical protein
MSTHLELIERFRGSYSRNNKHPIDLQFVLAKNHSRIDSIEQSYYSLSLTELGTILHFTSLDEARQFVNNRPNWRLTSDDIVWFDKQPETKLRTHDDMLARAVDLSIQISALA